MKEGYIPFKIIGDDIPVLIHVDGIPEGDYVRIQGGKKYQKWSFMPCKLHA